MIRRARNLQEGMGMIYRRRTVSFKEHLYCQTCQSY